MINAKTAHKISEKINKEKCDIFLQIDKKITEQANKGEMKCIYEIYPDCSISLDEIISKLKELGYEVDVNTYDEADLEFETEYCHVVVISW